MEDRYFSRTETSSFSDGAWLNAFLKRFSPDSPSILWCFTAATLTLADGPAPYVRLDEAISREEVQVAISVSGDTAPGFDGIPYAFLRNRPESSLRVLTQLYLQCRIKIVCENKQQAKAIIESDLPKTKGWKIDTPTARNFRYGIVRNLDEEITEEDILQDFESEQCIVEAQ